MKALAIVVTLLLVIGIGILIGWNMRERRTAPAAVETAPAAVEAAPTPAATASNQDPTQLTNLGETMTLPHATATPAVKKAGPLTDPKCLPLTGY
ncbi:MAG: hypothetical protein ACYCW6_28375 [Candidatus Xenobia bacterium]